MTLYLYLAVGIIVGIAWFLLTQLRTRENLTELIRNPGDLRPDYEKGVISYQQAMLLLITLVIATANIFLPAFVAGHAGSDSWLSVILATVVALALGFLYLNLGLRFPGETVIEYSPKLLGNFLGTLVGLGYFWFFFHTAALTTCELCALMTTAFMPETPELAFTLPFLFLSVYALYRGIEVIARFNEFLLPIGWLLLTLVVFASIPDMDFTRMLPVLGNGLKPVIRGSIDIISSIGEIAVILMLIPFFNQASRERPHKIYLGMASVVQLLGIALFFGTFIIAIFGVELTAAMTFPALELIRNITIANFLERFDIAAMVIWSTGIFVKLAVFYFASALALAQLLGLKSYRPVVMPLALIITFLSSTEFGNIIELLYFYGELYPYYAAVFEMIFPLILISIALIRGYKHLPYNQGIKEELK